MAERRCRICGCRGLDACIGDDGLPCYWVEPDLCSACDPRGGAPVIGLALAAASGFAACALIVLIVVGLS